MDTDHALPGTGTSLSISLVMCVCVKADILAEPVGFQLPCSIAPRVPWTDAMGPLSLAESVEGPGSFECL